MIEIKWVVALSFGKITHPSGCVSLTNPGQAIETTCSKCKMNAFFETFFETISPEI